jgi:hypothetical protein
MRNISDTSLSSNNNKEFVSTPNRPYFYYSARLQTSLLSSLINIGKTANSQSVILYLNASVYGNYVRPQFFDNTYWQVQVGIALDIGGLLGSPSGASKSSSSTDSGSPSTKASH